MSDGDAVVMCGVPQYLHKVLRNKLVRLVNILWKLALYVNDKKSFLFAMEKNGLIFASH